MDPSPARAESERWRKGRRSHAYEGRDPQAEASRGLHSAAPSGSRRSNPGSSPESWGSASAEPLAYTPILAQFRLSAVQAAKGATTCSRSAPLERIGHARAAHCLGDRRISAKCGWISFPGACTLIIYRLWNGL